MSEYKSCFNSIVHLQNQDELATEISRHIEKGFRITPLLGSGLSAPSGIPTTDEFRNFLYECLRRVYDPGESKPFRPGEDPWPALRYHPRADRWMNEHRLGHGTNPDWLSMLEELARIRFDSEGRPRLQRYVDSSITDSFFNHIVYNKRPNFGHRMLARLMPLAGSNLTLTLNFDTLIEDAHLETATPLQVFEVAIGSVLPTPAIVSRAPSLIKLHGGRTGLRAGAAADELPHERDKAKFAEYFVVAQKSSSKNNSARPQAIAVDALLVAGFSGEDERVLKFIQHLCQTHNKQGLTVFWLTYNQKDAEKLVTLFGEPVGNSNTKRRSAPRLVTSSVQDLGLFFLDIYQRRTYRLPESQVMFPAVSHYPLPRSVKGASGEFETPISNSKNSLGKVYNGTIDAARKRLLKEIKSLSISRVLKVEASDDACGAASVSSAAYRELAADGNFSIWVELEDVYDTYDFAYTLYQLVCAQSHMKMSAPCCIRGTNLNEIVAATARMLSQRKGNVYIFCNARVPPGRSLKDPSLDNSLLRKTELPPPLWDSLTISNFCIYLHTLIENFDIASEQGKTSILCPIVVCGENEFPSIPTILHIKKSILKLKPKEDARAAYREHRTNGRNASNSTLPPLRFIRSLALMRRPMYLAGLTARAFHLDGKDSNSSSNNNNRSNSTFDKERKELVEQWLSNQSSLGKLVAIKAAGLVWISEQVRSHLRDCHKNVEPLEDMEILQGIADWYDKLYFASEHSFAVFESFHYRALCIELCLENIEDARLHDYGLSAATQMLWIFRIARPRLLVYNNPYNLYHRMRLLKDRLTEVSNKLDKLYAREQNDVWHAFLRIIACTINEVGRILFDLSRYNGAHPPGGDIQEFESLPTMPIGREISCWDYERMVLQIVTRRYDQAEKSLERLWEKYNIGCASSVSEFLRLTRREVHSSATKLFVVESLSSPPAARGRKPNSVMASTFEYLPQDRARLLVRCMRRFIQVQVERIEILLATEKLLKRKCSAKRDDTNCDIVSVRNEIACHVEEARRGYLAVREVNRSIFSNGVSGFVLRESSRCRSNVALALAGDKDWNEAFRRLSESQYHLASSHSFLDGIWKAEIDLRAADVMLRRVEDIQEIYTKNLGRANRKKASLDRFEDPAKAIRYMWRAHEALRRGESRMRESRLDAPWLAYSKELRLRLAISLRRWRSDVPELSIPSALEPYDDYLEMLRRTQEGLGLARGDIYRHYRLQVLFENFRRPGERNLGLQEPPKFDLKSFEELDPQVLRYIDLACELYGFTPATPEECASQ